MAKKYDEMDFIKNQGKILNILEKRDIICPVFSLTEQGRKKVIAIYENNQLWTDLIDSLLDWISELWDQVKEECADTKQNQNNFAVINAYDSFSKFKDMLENHPLSFTLLIDSSIDSDIELLSHFFIERVITQVFGRPYDLEGDKYKGVDIETEINNAMNEICKKKKKKS